MRILSLFALIVLVLTVSCSIQAQSSSTVPSKVTECYSSAEQDFTTTCNALQANTSWAVSQQLSAAICNAAAVFGPRPWAGASLEGKDMQPQRNNVHKAVQNKEKILHSIHKKTSSNGKLNFPGWSTASKRIIISNGRYTYDDWNAAVDDSISQFDMASCSKIMATTTSAAQLYQLGFIDLDEKVSSPRLLGPDFANQGKGDITIRNLLLHNAGFPPDPVPNYNLAEFPCKNNVRYHPVQDFDCVETIYNNLLFNQTLVYPTGSKYIYSDLSMITLMFVISKVVSANNLIADSAYPPVCAGLSKTARNCPFYAWVYNNVFLRYNLQSTLYIPSTPLTTVPEWNSDWHHGIIQGYVSDQNAFALGGIAGHAGVFSTARDALTFMSIWMDNQDPAMLNETTVQLWTTVYNTTQSSRALGWDTNYGQNTCGTLSPKTFFHIGFTGTQFCGDPTTGTVTVLLANGRYPNFSHDGMITYRPMYNSLVNQLLNGGGADKKQ
jgi:serine-type D-Ala-D-Ala carboxypeptidase